MEANTTNWQQLQQDFEVYRFYMNFVLQFAMFVFGITGCRYIRYMDTGIDTWTPITEALSGQGVAMLGEESHPIGPGDFIGCPLNGAAHCMKAEGSEPLVCLVVGQRLPQDVSDYPNFKTRLYRSNGEWNLVEHSNIQYIKR